MFERPAYVPAWFPAWWPDSTVEMAVEILGLKTRPVSSSGPLHHFDCRNRTCHWCGMREWDVRSISRKDLHEFRTLCPYHPSLKGRANIDAVKAQYEALFTRRAEVVK